MKASGQKWQEGGAVALTVLGMIAYVFREHVRLNAIAAATLVILLLALWWTPLFHVLMPLAIVYTTFWFAFVPKGSLLMFNRLGDYSYGIYVFAAPIQQLCLTLVGPQTASANFALALVPTLILAILSWHFLESRCIGSRRRLTGRFQNSSRRALTST